MANHINRSKDPEVIVNTIIQSCDTEQIQVCVMRVPLSSSSDESEPMSVERRMISDEELADSKRLHNQIASVKTQMYDPETGCVYEHCEKSPVGADPFYDLAVHLSTIFSEGTEEDCDHE